MASAAAFMDTAQGALDAAKATAQTYVEQVQQWFDVDHQLAEDIEENTAIRNKIGYLQRLEVQRAQWHKESLEREYTRYKAVQAAVEEEAAPTLKALDQTDTSVFVYDDLIDTAKNQMQDVERAAKLETQSYGYESKMLVSLNVTAEALWKKLRAPEGGASFSKELRALQQELTDSADIETVAAPLEPCAAQGLPAESAVQQSARSVAATIEAARLEAAKYSPVATPLMMLKFATPLDRAVVKRRTEDARIDSFVGRAAANDYAAAIRTAGAVKAAHPEPEVAAAVDTFCDMARQRLAAENLERYIQAVVATQRHALVVNLFQEKENDARGK